MNKNPFIPLTREEQQNIVSYFKMNIISEELLLSGDVIFDYVGLKQPKKKSVLKYLNNDGSPPKRKAEVRIYYYTNDKYVVYEVFLQNSNVVKIISCDVIKKARPSFNCADENKAIETSLQNEEVLKALYDAGVKPDQVQNVSFDVSVDGRIYKACPCKKCKKYQTKCNPNITKIIYETKPRPHSFCLVPFWNDNDIERDPPYAADVSFYNQPIGNILIIYDRLSDSVLKVYNGHEEIPIQKGNLNWTNRPKGETLNKIKSTTKNNFTINQNVVNWSDWQFTIGFDPTIGLILYDVSFLDRTVWIEDKTAKPVRRSILYQAGLSELITAYANPEEPLQKNFLDINEYPARDFIVPQIKDIDYPEYAELLSFDVTLPNGTNFPLENVVSIYEKDSGFLWRHTGYSCNYDRTDQGLSGIELHVSTVHVIANYDYMFNWIFTLDGRIKYQVCASGVLETSATKLTSISKNEDEMIGGSLIKPNVFGLTHSHCANIRLDFAIDGNENTIAEVDYVNKKSQQTNPYGNFFTEEETVLKTEKDATRKQNFDKLRSWVIYNENSENYLGYHRGYKIEPGLSIFNLYQKDERIIKRANYMLNSINVSLYRDGEYYALGKYPVESEKDTGIRKYIKNDENIVNKDIVVWYSVGFGHKPDVEQYPVMNKEIIEFSIVPENFFNENPALYINNPI